MLHIAGVYNMYETKKTKYNDMLLQFPALKLQVSYSK